MAKVYVSSTVADLERERRAVLDWLVAARHQPVHSYVPSSETVRDSCLEDVDWTPTGFVDTIRSGTMVYEERTGSGTGSQEVHPGV